MKLNCIIIDDEPSSINLLKDYIASIPYLNLINEYQNPLLALRDIKSGPKIDLTFLDIEMPELNGVQLYELIKDKLKFIVITSGHLSSAVEAFDLNANAFLLKPFTFQKFKQKIDAIIETGLKPSFSREFIWIKCDPKNQIKKIYIDEIIYIEGASNYVKIHTEFKTYITYLKMSDFENDLIFQNGIFRVNKSYIIAEKHIQNIVNDSITLSNKCEIKIGSTYKSKLKNSIKLFTVNKK